MVALQLNNNLQQKENRMKTKLAVIVLVMAVVGWLARGDSPRVQTTQEDVAILKQAVAQLSKTVASQQTQIDQLSHGGTNDGLSQRVTYLEQLVAPFFDRVYVDYTGYIVYKVPVDFSADFIFCHNIYYHELTYYY